MKLAVAYFGKSKWSLKLRSDKHERYVRNCDCDKNEIAKHCWKADRDFSWNQKKFLIGKGKKKKMKQKLVKRKKRQD